MDIYEIIGWVMLVFLWAGGLFMLGAAWQTWVSGGVVNDHEHIDEDYGDEMTRFTMVEQSKGVWDLVKAKDGPWMLFDVHEKVVAEQRQEIERLKAEKDDMVIRNKLLRNRPDLPLERVRDYDELVQKLRSLQAKFTDERRYQELVHHIVEHDDADFSPEVREETEQYGLEALMKLKVQLATANEEIARLREALGKLHGLQNGCPLPKYEAEYLYCMMQVERLLCLDKEEHP